MDVHVRDELGTPSRRAAGASRPLVPFRTGRRAFGVTFFLSTFTISQVLPLKETWDTVALTVGAAALLATVLTLVNMRAMSSA
jgi:hypothetical protein